MAAPPPAGGAVARWREDGSSGDPLGITLIRLRPVCVDRDGVGMMYAFDVQ
jgi:hypothetical protein